MIRIGILGAAGIAPQGLIRPVARRDDMQMVAVAARSLESAQRFAAANGIPRAYAGYDALLADDEIDLVYIALHPAAHAEWAIAALEAGKHVLCEKPFAMNAAEARAAVAVAERTGLHLIEAFHDHYHPLIGELGRIVAGGQLGRLTSVHARFTADNPFSLTSIRHVPELGGGALMDLGCYPAHWLRALGGAEPLVTSATFVPNPLGADMAIDAALAFPDGPFETAGVTLHASMMPGVAFDASVVITGERGELRAENVVLPHRGHSVATIIDGISRTWTVGGRETYDHELDAVTTAITSGNRADTESEDIIATMDLLDRIYAMAGVVRP